METVQRDPKCEQVAELTRSDCLRARGRARQKQWEWIVCALARAYENVLLMISFPKAGFARANERER